MAKPLINQLNEAIEAGDLAKAKEISQVLATKDAIAKKNKKTKVKSVLKTKAKKATKIPKNKIVLPTAAEIASLEQEPATETPEQTQSVRKVKRKSNVRIVEEGTQSSEGVAAVKTNFIKQKRPNLFSDDKTLFKKDMQDDKKLAIRELVPRREAAEQIEVECRVCHKTYKVEASLVNSDLYRCNKCCIGGGR